MKFLPHLIIGPGVISLILVFMNEGHAMMAVLCAIIYMFGAIAENLTNRVPPENDSED